MAVQFFMENKITLRERTRLKAFIQELFHKEGFDLKSATYVFCSDEYLLNLNRHFLKHDYYTDIITFDLSPTPNEKQGEIYISTDRVKDNAKNLGNSFQSELHRVILHGALHLCGYKDKKTSEQKEMRKMEDKYLNLYFQVK